MTVSKYYTPSGRLIQKAYDNGSKVDTVEVFKTTTMGREVYAGGGIIPDIEVEDRIDWEQPELMTWMDIISEYAIRYNLVHHDGEIVDVDQIPSIHTTLPKREELFKELNALAAKRSRPSQLDSLIRMQNQQPDLLYRVAQATMVAYRTGEEGWYIAFNETDPVIEKAREVVKLDLLMALKQ